MWGEAPLARWNQIRYVRAASSGPEELEKKEEKRTTATSIQTKPAATRCAAQKRFFFGGGAAPGIGTNSLRSKAPMMAAILKTKVSLVAWLRPMAAPASRIQAIFPDWL